METSLDPDRLYICFEHVDSSSPLRTTFVYRSLPPPGGFYTGSRTRVNTVQSTPLLPRYSISPAVFQLDDRDNEYIANMFSYFISRHGQNLVSLSSSISPRQIARLSVNLAEACPHLQELILPDRTILSENFIHPNIPLKITHLGLGGVLINDMAMLNKSIDWVNPLPDIRRVTLRIYPVLSLQVSDSPMILHWREKCMDQVDIDWIESSERLPVTDDMIRAFRFPRGGYRLKP
ncbi:hypothetical protein FRC02_005057 [Tulasnella sp. 418]|nr:hypothetical protein FRC02_005057 [Tulasnella sp. 418]